MKNIFKYSDFIFEYSNLTDTRSQVITIPENETPIDVIREMAPWYLKNLSEITPIFRGLTPNKGFFGKNRYLKQDIDYYEDCLLIKPSQHERIARNTDNHYITIIDNSKYWEGFPKRSKSIICSTDNKYAQLYGAVYRVIPLKENSEFVVCPKSDVFISFEYLFKEMKLNGFRISNDSIIDVHKIINAILNLKNLMNTITTRSLKMKMNKFIKMLQNGEYQKDGYWYWLVGKFVEKFVNGEIKWTDLYVKIEEWMDPKLNGFSKIKYSGKIEIPFGREVYTDADCLLILESEFQNIINA
jgi:hypothetical protein